MAYELHLKPRLDKAYRPSSYISMLYLVQSVGRLKNHERVILTNVGLPGDRLDPVWLSGRILVRQTRCPA